MQFLVILRVKPGITQEQIEPLVKSLALHVWEGIKSGAVRQIWYFTDASGAISGVAGIGEVANEQQLEHFIGQLSIDSSGWCSKCRRGATRFGEIG